MVIFSYMNLNTSDPQSIQFVLKKINFSLPKSHKGQNGRVLIIGGSSLFHAASIWAAEIASHFVDITHYSSTEENNEIMRSLKKKFINGIIISKENLIQYVEEDDCVLVGPGMLRKDRMKNYNLIIKNFEDLFSIKDEAEYSHYVTKYLIHRYPKKKFVFDAGSLQMMNPEWLRSLESQAIITPHQIEFEKLFNQKIISKSFSEKVDLVCETAKKYHCIIVCKAIDDIISDGKSTYVISGGNQGLTKGGTGDVLAGLITSFYAKNEAIDSAILGSYLLKKSADNLFQSHGYWYNISEIIQQIPKSMKLLTSFV